MNKFFSILLVTFFIFGIVVSSGLQASVNKLCDESIEKVAYSTSVPKHVLYKIARLESGRRYKGDYVSWPWSLNNAGKGYVLDTKTEALNKLSSLMKRGKKNIDVGCMQLNLRWHARYFDSIEEMMSPDENVAYAAKFLQQLFKETGTWEKSVKFYHSRNSKFSDVYYAKFQKMPIPNLVKSDKLVSLKKFESSTGKPKAKKDILNQPLFWVKPTGSMVNFGPQIAGEPAFADLRDFKMPPLFKM